VEVFLSSINDKYILIILIFYMINYIMYRGWDYYFILTPATHKIITALKLYVVFL
jgi:hypothetical protein